ncbi:MAG: hypothetical protein GC185_08775 [Alphaproteobacteria bacterium]|nr:hypothetical protein [Alphaproteobacteria bacterium]
MALTLDELDGTYEVRTEISGAEQDPYDIDGNGTTRIHNGQTFRKDQQGMIWESEFTIIGEDKVQMKSTLDPSHARGGGQFIKDEKGNLTKAMVSYTTELTASRDGEGRVVLNGAIEHGGVTTLLTLTKIADE